MLSRVNRETVDLSSYPDLVVVYLGMRVNRLYGLRTLMARGPRIGRSDDKPEGLLAQMPRCMGNNDQRSGGTCPRC